MSGRCRIPAAKRPGPPRRRQPASDRLCRAPFRPRAAPDGAAGRRDPVAEFLCRGRGDDGVLRLRRPAHAARHDLSVDADDAGGGLHDRSEEHTSELQSLMRISYAVFCLKKKKNTKSTESDMNISVE